MDIFIYFFAALLSPKIRIQLMYDTKSKELFMSVKLETLTKEKREKKRKKREKIGENSSPPTLLQVDSWSATDCNADARAKNLCGES